VRISDVVQGRHRDDDGPASPAEGLTSAALLWTWSSLAQPSLFSPSEIVRGTDPRMTFSGQAAAPGVARYESGPACRAPSGGRVGGVEDPGVPGAVRRPGRRGRGPRCDPGAAAARPDGGWRVGVALVEPVHAHLPVGLVTVEPCSRRTPASSAPPPSPRASSHAGTRSGRTAHPGRCSWSANPRTPRHTRLRAHPHQSASTSPGDPPILTLRHAEDDLRQVLLTRECPRRGRREHRA
jgi:hypothetical protein